MRSQPETGTGDALDIGVERRVVLLVVGRVIADDVDEGCVRAAGVVQVREPVAQPGAEVQQRRRGLVGHARVAIGRAGDDALEETEHASHLGHGVERGDEVHLGGAGIGEAHVDIAVDEGLDQGLRAVHWWVPRFRPVGPVSRRSCRG